jgi:hypothetical protein
VVEAVSEAHLRAAAALAKGLCVACDRSITRVPAEGKYIYSFDRLAATLNAFTQALKPGAWSRGFRVGLHWEKSFRQALADDHHQRRGGGILPAGLRARLVSLPRESPEWSAALLRLLPIIVLDVARHRARQVRQRLLISMPGE